MNSGQKLSGASEKSGVHRHVQIFFYSTLIAVMSALSHVRTRLEPKISHRVPPEGELALGNSLENDALTATPGFWIRTGHALTAFFIWMILGFTAGFLFGIVPLR